MDCKKEEAGQFINLESEHVHIFDVKPAEAGRGIIIRVNNVKDDNSEAQLSFPGRLIMEAYESNILEEQLNSLATLDVNTLHISLGPKQIKHLLIILEK
jgi:alpha-mannosidase